MVEGRLAELRMLPVVAPRGALDDEWKFLLASERKLTMLMNGEKPGPEQAGDAEFGPALYVLNNAPKLLPRWSLFLDGVVDVLRGLGMPRSGIDATTWNGWLGTLRGAGVVAGDGTLVAGDGSFDYLHKYVAYDPGWLWAVVHYAMVKVLPKKYLHEFHSNGKRVTAPPKRPLTIALTGDWGSGYWSDGAKPRCPSKLVLDAVQGLDPDYVIHLGDVYYAGTKEELLLPGEEYARFVELWKPGREGTFTLNSNHEMYDGAFGLFDVALDPGRTRLFAAQNQTTYFALDCGDVVVLGLDSAYFDPSSFFMKGALFDPTKPVPPGAQCQLDFIKEHAQGKRVIVLTHHVGLTTLGEPNEPLWSQVLDAIPDGVVPDFWYWGHVHNGIVHADAVSKRPRCRCTGHGALPFGRGYTLDEEFEKGRISYFAKTAMQDPEEQQRNRVLNGFALLTLGEQGLTEEFYEVSNEAEPSVAWCSTTKW